MKQFVPITDDMLYRGGGPPGPLVPYCVGMMCGWMAGAEAGGAYAESVLQRVTASASPGLSPSLSAVPALSSSTYWAGSAEG